MSGGINTPQSLLSHSPTRGEGQRAGDPVTATLHLHFPLPLLGGPTPVRSVPCKVQTILVHAPHTPPPTQLRQPPTPTCPSVISSLSKTAQLHYLSVAMLLLGKESGWGEDGDAQPPHARSVFRREERQRNNNFKVTRFLGKKFCGERRENMEGMERIIKVSTNCPKSNDADGPIRPGHWADY